MHTSLPFMCLGGLVQLLHLIHTSLYSKFNIMARGNLIVYGHTLKEIISLVRILSVLFPLQYVKCYTTTSVWGLRALCI